MYKEGKGTATPDYVLKTKGSRVADPFPFYCEEEERVWPTAIKLPFRDFFLSNAPFEDLEKNITS